MAKLGAESLQYLSPLASDWTKHEIASDEFKITKFYLCQRDWGRKIHNEIWWKWPLLKTFLMKLVSLFFSECNITGPCLIYSDFWIKQINCLDLLL